MTRLFIIYSITNKNNNKQYIGVTQRTLDQRVRSHLSESKNKGTHPDGLPAALREMHQKGLLFDQCFTTEIIESNLPTKEYALSREKHYVTLLNTRVPFGYNVLNGGSSAGAINNAKPITIELEDKSYNFKSIIDAVSFVNSDSKTTNLLDHTVRMRLAADWTIHEAFNLEPHTDKRTLRNPFIYNGELFHSIGPVSKATGISNETLRSRIYRRKNLPNHDISQRIPGKKNSSSNLPHPQDATLDGITSREFSIITKIPQTTVSSRAKRYRESNASTENRDDLLHYILKRKDRIIYVELTLANGIHIKESLNSFAKRVETGNGLEGYKNPHLTVHTIRSRLQKYFKETPPPTTEGILKALGLI